MKQIGSDFLRNLRDGVRLVFAMPVSLLDFRIGVRQLLLLFAFGAARHRRRLRARWRGSDVLLDPSSSRDSRSPCCALAGVILGAVFRQPHLRLAVPVLVLAGSPVLNVSSLAAAIAARRGDYIGAWVAYAGFWVLVAWQALLSGASSRSRWLRAARTSGCARSAAPHCCCSSSRSRSGRTGPGGTTRLQVGRELALPSPASEEVLAAQPDLLDDALDALEDERPGITDLYFVGFAPYAREDVFRKDMERARDLFDDRFDTDGRSIVLINNPRTVLDEPLATVSNLRATLNEIGAAIDPRRRRGDALSGEPWQRATTALRSNSPPLELRRS